MITQDYIEKIKSQSAITADEYILKQLIEEHDTRNMEEGVRYYKNDSDIKRRKIYYFKDGQKVEDTEATNNRVPHNWHKILVDQKTSYLLGKPAVISAESEQFTEKINEYLDEDWDDIIQEIAKESSNKGVEYLHPYIGEDRNFKYVQIPGEQGMPIYDTDFQQEMVGFIRYYPMWVNGKERIRAEWWDKEQVTYYKQGEGSTFVIDDTEEENPSPHFKVNNQGYGWGKVPFIEFKNNEEKMSDLEFYKDLIDIYDLVNSDMSNDLTDIQKILYVLKGYDGTDLEEFTNNLRYYKAIKTDEEGGVDLKQADIPVEAINAFLDRTEENIFLFGQGVNVKTDKFGNSPSGIALKFLFHLLDLKANTMARKFNRAIKKFIWFLASYIQIIGEGNFTDEKVTVTYTKSMMMNELEQTQIAQASKGIISDKTIISNHPWVEDEQKEAEQMEEEQTVELPEVGEEE